MGFLLPAEIAQLSAFTIPYGTKILHATREFENNSLKRLDNAQAKLGIDLWYTIHPGGVFRDKRIGIVLTYGDDDLNNFGGINANNTYELMFCFLDADITGILHGNAHEIGDAEKQPKLMENTYQLGQKLSVN